MVIADVELGLLDEGVQAIGEGVSMDEEFLGRKAETNMSGYKIEKWFNNIYVSFFQQEIVNEDEQRRGRMDKI